MQELGNISGTVTDLAGGIISGAKVTLDDSASGEHRETVTDTSGAFIFEGLRGNASYAVTIRMKDYVTWSSSAISLSPGQHLSLTDIPLKTEGEEASVTVYASSDEVATAQVQAEEKQRVLGVIPNFYVVYDSKNAVPLTTKLKFKLALRVSTDPISIGGVAFLAGIRQAGASPNYVEGAKGYGERFGAEAANSFSDILVGGAILPSLLHQDPRYFYQGTGTTKSRLRHALSSPFICKGDNGQWQPNYSSIGGDLASSALSTTYYPRSNRGAGMVFDTFAVNTAERLLSTVAQEFLLSRLTSNSRK